MNNLSKLIIDLVDLDSMPHENTYESAQAYHAWLKDDDGRWNTLKFVGIQKGDATFHLELRNCPCRSTIARIVELDPHGTK